MGCIKCGSEDVRVHIEGVGDFCLDCYNEMAEELSDSRHVEHPDFAVSFDADGHVRVFDVEHMHFGHMVQWTAVERDADPGERVVVDADPEADPKAVFDELYEKISRRLANPSTHTSEVPEKMRGGSWPDAVWRGDWRYLGLEQRGVATIESNYLRDGYHLVIDGREVTFEEFGKMLGSYAGWEIEWNIKEAGDPGWLDGEGGVE